MGNKMKETFYGHLDRLIDGKLPYAIWGAGQSGIEAIKLIREYRGGSWLPEYSIDNNPALWMRPDIVSPSEFFDGKMNNIDTVFICVYVADEVEKQLIAGGYKGRIVKIILSAFVNTGYSVFLKNNVEKIKNLHSLLADDRSRDTIDVLIRVCDEGDIDLWKGINGNSEDKLLDPEILKFSDNEYFLEVGAFIGDTTERFIELVGNKYRRIVGLEPDPCNYKVLKEAYDKYHRALPLQYAADNTTGVVRFTGNRSEGGYVAEDGDIEVEAVRLDDLEDAKEASFIKVSANGGDLKALMGAEAIIRERGPKLSYYCGWHKIWQIPMYLYEINPNYRFYIRHYGIGTQAMIGYAVVE